MPINSVPEKAIETLSKARHGSPYVSAGSDQRLGRIGLWFEECVGDVRIADFRWHDLQHTFASCLAMAGVSLRTLAELLGHKSIAMVMRYAHLAPAHLRDAVERIAGTRTDTIIDTTPAYASDRHAVLLN